MYAHHRRRKAQLPRISTCIKAHTYTHTQTHACTHILSQEGTAAANLDLRAELLKFYKTYYSANQMTLAVCGRGMHDMRVNVSRVCVCVCLFIWGECMKWHAVCVRSTFAWEWMCQKREGERQRQREKKRDGEWERQRETERDRETDRDSVCVCVCVCGACMTWHVENALHAKWRLYNMKAYVKDARVCVCVCVWRNVRMTLARMSGQIHVFYSWVIYIYIYIYIYTYIYIYMKQCLYVCMTSEDMCE
jgi:hypothetical protein